MAGSSATGSALAALPRYGRSRLLRPTVFYYLLAAILAVLILYPLGVLLTASVFSGQPGRWGDFTLVGYESWLGAFELLPILLNSVLFSGGRLLVALALGLTFAWAVARTDVPFRRTMAWMLPVPFFIPGLLTGISWLMMGNPQNGLINLFARRWFGIQEPVIDIHGWFGMIFHSSLHATALVFLLLVGFFRSMDSSFEEASTTLGASKYKTVFTITLPMLMPAILSVSILLFASGLDAFEDPLLFGNPGGVFVFANEIYRMLYHRHPPQYNAATALSVILIFITFSLLWLQWKKLGGRQFTVISGKGYRPNRIRLPNPVRWGIFALFVLYVLLAIVVPIAQIIISSFFKIFGFYRMDTLTLDNWVKIMSNERVMLGLRNTILYSTAAGIGTVILAGLIGYIRVRDRHWLGRVLELIAWTPWTVPGVALGLAMLWAWALPPEPFNLYGTWLLIVLGFMVKGMPLATATMQAAVHQVNKELEESSRTHGATWLATMRFIMLPLVRRGAIATFVIVFALGVRDLTIPILLYQGDTETLSVALLSYYESGQLSVLSVAAVLQLVLILAVLSLERLTRSKAEAARDD
jgi:iron(III) transport system permease protein